MIKEKRHPSGMIDLTIVPYSMVASDGLKVHLGIAKSHHVLIIDMGENE